MEKEENILGYEKIGKLIRKFSIPCIISLLVNSLYNIVDQIFIGWGVGYLGNGATNVVFPLTMICLAFALMFGDGASAYLSLKLGQKKNEEAAKGIGNGISLSVIISIILFTIIELFLPTLLNVFGCTDEFMSYALSYGRIIGVGLPFMIIGTTLNSMIRADGKPKYAMTSMVIGAILNVILDPIFIFVFGLGISGAAIATVISQILSASFVIFFLRCKSELKIRLLHLNEITGCVEYAKNIVSLGTAGFIMQVTNSLVSICCNNVLSVTGGDVYISVMTIVSSVRQMVETPIYAINEGSSPILSYNYGANRPGRVRKAGVVMGCLILGYTAIMWTLIIVAPHFLIQIFSSDSALIADAVPALKLYFAAFIFMDLQYIGQTFFKSLNKKKHAIFFSLLRKVVIVVPLTYIFPYLFNMGSNGVFLAEPISNVIGGSMCFITMLCTILPELKRMENK